MDLQTISDHVPIPAVTSAPLNPLISLVAAVLRACIYLLQVLRRVVAFVTLTIPSLMVRILGWSWTLQVSPCAMLSPSFRSRASAVCRV